MINNEQINKLRDLAFNTTDFSIQENLKNHTDIGIRRNLALNKNLKTSIANYLIENDLTINVIFCAMNNKNSTSKKDIRTEDLKNKCVSCNLVDIFYNKCLSCN